MVIDWLRFSGALLLLLVPIALFHGPRVRYRSVSRDWDRHWPRIFSLGLHSIDLGRAALGAWLLTQAVERVPGATGLLRQGVLLTDAAVLGVAVLVQTFVCKERDAAHAPFAFVIGLVAGFLPPLLAGFAVLLAIAIAIGARMPAALFLILAASVMAIGYFFVRSGLPGVAIVAGAVALPSLATAMFPRRLVVSYRAKRSTVTPFAGQEQH
jgi:hypothetical protein